MGITIVQTLPTAGAASVASLQSSAFGSAVTAGNTIVVLAGGLSNAVQTGSGLTFTDTAGNTYTPDVGSDNLGTFPLVGAQTWAGVWRCTNCLGGSSFKITFHTNNSTSYVNFTALEVSGLAVSPLDGSGSKNRATSGTTATTGAFSTTNAADLLVAILNWDAGGSDTGPPTNFTQIYTVAAGANEGGEADYWITNAIQTNLNPSWTVPNGAWCAAAMAYKGVSGGLLERRRKALAV